MVQSKKQTFRKTNGRKNRSMRKIKAKGSRRKTGKKPSKTKRRQKKGGEIRFLKGWRPRSNSCKNVDQEDDQRFYAACEYIKNKSGRHTDDVTENKFEGKVDAKVFFDDIKKHEGEDATFKKDLDEIIRLAKEDKDLNDIKDVGELTNSLVTAYGHAKKRSQEAENAAYKIERAKWKGQYNIEGKDGEVNMSGFQSNNPIDEYADDGGDESVKKVEKSRELLDALKNAVAHNEHESKENAVNDLLVTSENDWYKCGNWRNYWARHEIRYNLKQASKVLSESLYKDDTHAADDNKAQIEKLNNLYNKLDKKAEELGEKKYEKNTPEGLLIMYNNNQLKDSPMRKDSLMAKYLQKNQNLRDWVKKQNPNVLINEFDVPEGLK